MKLIDGSFLKKIRGYEVMLFVLRLSLIISIFVVPLKLHAAQFYASVQVGANDTALYRVDTTFMTSTLIGNNGAYLTDIALLGGVLYGVTDNQVGIVNQLTGAFSVESNLGPLKIEAMGAKGSLLYMGSSSNDNLYIVDPSSSYSISSGSRGTGYTAIGDIAFTNSTFYITTVSSFGAVLENSPIGTLPSTTANPVISSLGLIDLQGLGWDPLSGQLWVTSEGSMYVISPTGVIDEPGEINFFNGNIIFTGLAQVPVPEPSTYIALGSFLGIALLVAKRKKRSQSQHY